MIHHPDKLLLIAGPCSLETSQLPRRSRPPEITGRNISGVEHSTQGLVRQSQPHLRSSDRGTGIDKGLAIFETIKAEYGFKTITDIHLPEQCSKVGAVVDALQIPAFFAGKRTC